MNAHAGEFTTQSEIAPQEVSSQNFPKKSDSNSQFYQQGLEIIVPAATLPDYTTNGNSSTSEHCVYPALPIPPPPYQIQSGIAGGFGGGGGGGVSNSSSTAPLLGKCAMVKSNTTDSTLSNLSISSINQPQPRQSFDVALLDNNMTSSLPRLGLIGSQHNNNPHPNSYTPSSITTQHPITMQSENHYCRDSIVKLNPSVLQTEKSSSRIKSNQSSSRISVKNLTILTLIAASLFAMTLAFLLTLWFCLEYFECETKGSCGNSHGPLKFKQN